MKIATTPFRLWENAAPGALGQQEHDIPTLTPFIPEKINPKKTVVLVLPGGGYGGLADHEGSNFALYFNHHNIAAFVLKYRLGTNGYRHPRMLQDAARALRTIRYRANEFGVNPNLIGIIGSSAGGHLTSTLLTHFDHGEASAHDPIDRLSSRPDFGILCYPVITMKTKTHGGSRDNLLGTNPSQELLDDLSNETQVTPQTPPTFIWHTWEDQAVPVENSLMFAEALQKNNVPFDLHIYQKGNHGLGLTDNPPFTNVHPWGRDLIYWIKQNNFAE